MERLAIEVVGLIAQALFSGRMIVQWVMSERARKVVSPVIFWQMSMVASFLLCIYGWLGNDFVIILGQAVAYYIYIWNLYAKGSWQQMHGVLRAIFLCVPMVAGVWLLAFHWDATMARLFTDAGIPMWLFVYGIAGQAVFSVRFIYQWLYSSRRGESVLPIGFWIISFAGSLLIIPYAVMRGKWAYLLGQVTGLIVYARNIMIARNECRCSECRAER